MPVTNYIWDRASSNVLSEVDDTGATIAEYTHEPGQFGELISQRRDSINSYFHFDTQGSTRQLTSDDQTVTDTYSYTAFGETVSKSGSTVNPFGYKGAIGYHIDQETDGIYVRRRIYQPTIIRWQSADPLLFTDGPNRYIYVKNDPILYTDPSGRLRTVATRISNLGVHKCNRQPYQYFRFRFDERAGIKNPTPLCDGVVVQKVDVTCNIDYCGEGNKEWQKTFWEAWDLTEEGRWIDNDKRGVVDPVRSPQLPPTPPAKSSFGELTSDGKAKFFCFEKEEPQKMGVSIANWQPMSFSTPCGHINTHGLKATDDPNEVKWWDQPTKEKPTERVFKVCWDCCLCKDDKIISQANPAWIDGKSVSKEIEAC